MQNLPDYTVGGTLHLIVNNQVGFTTSPFQGRSGYYCTDLALSIDAPVFHVNADCLESVCRVFQIAAEYRQEFKQDVFIDLIGYRKMGHNELDQPSFTQPLMYKIINTKQPVRNMYRQQLINEGIPEAELLAIEAEADKENESSYAASKTHVFNAEDWRTEHWDMIKDPEKYGKFKDTGVELKRLKEIGE
jgi:2-oxoglutarate dehydrogenase E1 component